MKNTEEKILNKEQREAVRYKNGPLLIIAGAGTGKTTVITERIKYLILKKGIPASQILALTFTEKASREMAERVDIAMPYGYTQMWISTFHSFCDRVLRDSALNIGLDPKYKLMTQAESIQLVRKHLFSLNLNYFRPLGNPNKFIEGMLKHFSRLQDEDISPSEYKKWVGKQGTSEDNKLEIEKWHELSYAYQQYDELKIKNSFLDFGDLIVKTLQLFRNRPNILKQYQKQFKYILVDEFQDTNYAQNEIAILLAGKSKKITVCGDDDQAIYRFRGAAISNIIQFRKRFPKAKVVVLTKNYRSTQQILDKAYNLIQFNNPDRLEAQEKIDKKLISQRNEKGESIEFIHTDRVENEADLVVKKIKELTKDGKYQFSDFAVLVRANNHSEPFIRAFLRLGIPYQFLGPGRLFKQPEIIDLIAYFKVLYNFEDSVSLFRLLSIEYLNIPARDLAAMGNYAKRSNLSLFEVCEKIDDVYISTDTKTKIKNILEIINRHLKLVRRETAGQLLYFFLQDLDLIKYFLSPDNLGAQKRAVNVSKFFDKLKTYEVDHEDATIPAVVEWIELASQLGESPLAHDTDWTASNAVNILTVHSSKGLEFRVVFLVNLVSQRFPTIERREQIPIADSLIKEVLPKGDYHIEEERRLFYVGMTRAADLLYFTASNFYSEGKREKRLSPFIFEALGDDLALDELTNNSQQLSFLDYEPKAKTSEVLTKEVQLPIHIDYLSYSQITTFRICPLHYKLKYILKIPTPPTSSQSFGTALHSALKDFYLSVKFGKRPTEKLIFRALSDNWIHEGFTSKLHEKKFLEKAKKFLSEYLKNQFDSKKIPVVLEQPFIIPLTPINKNKRFLKVGGRIDRVDQLDGRRIEIIDYKTGANIPTQRQVDHDLQMTFYALAATNVSEPPFNKNPQDVTLSLYFFDNQAKITTKRTKKDLDKAIDEIFIIREKIEKSDFKCSGHIFCQNCEYSLLCRED